MKSFIVIFCLYLISVQIEAQTRPGCPEFCPAVYMPVCGEAKVRGQMVRCEFGNGCVMGVSSCRHNISE
ncbi:hypothetical protein KR084_012218 [Drosophila pseudotakahashii]|nr:hypothetical protein KR084_012218 [Drosophila pseudotakahashii]